MLGILRRKKPEDDPTSIGNVLVEMKLLSESDLERIIEEFKASKEELLGQFIVRKSAITDDQLELALLKQKVMRGEGGQKVFDRLVEISQRSGQRVCNGLDELTTLAKATVKHLA